MSRTINTLAPHQIQATANCPVCGGTVYADGLEPVEPYPDPRTGEERFRKLIIRCQSCGQTRTVRPRSL